MEQRADKDLLQNIARGDEQAFQILFDRYWKTLFSFVYRLTKNESHTKDILQDVFMYLWTNRASVYAEDSILPYLNTIARSKVMTAFRKEKIKLQGIDVLIANLHRAANTDDALLFKEVKHKADKELSKMPFNMRECFQLSRNEGKSIRDIAGELKLSEQTVKNNISEAMRRLRISFEQGSLLYLSLWVFHAWC